VLQSAALPDYEARHVPDMVAAMARELRTRRQQVRLLAVAREQADALRNARRSSASVPSAGEPAEEDAPDVPVSVVGEMADEFVETTRRQRELTRRYQVAAGIRSIEDGEPELRGDA
jgi:hypothetical protein